MRIEVITAYHREEFLAPLFLMHYEPWTDCITILPERENQFDEINKTSRVNEAVKRSTADWVVVVDMDEFVFPLPLGTDPRAVLESAQCDMIYSEMVRIWRHHSDKDISRMVPPLKQRRHGQKDHVKPCIFRPPNVTMEIGNHSAQMPPGFRIGTPWSGSHWANADVCFWVARETRDRGPRLSQRNLEHGFSTHTLRTKEQILAEAEQHMDDPVVIG